ncbi:MAG: hypothetical protein ABEN55_04510 [Bradymonadaceae bacterium]
MRSTIRTRPLAVFALLCLTAFCLPACSGTDSPTDTPSDDKDRTAAITLTADTLADTDVARMQFQLQGVDCETGEPTDTTRQTTKDLEDTMLPGGFATFENAPLSSDSQHLFADAFFLVGAGCYNVTTQPLTDRGNPSEDCNPATRQRVSVEDGQTTEVLLVNQCRGADNGGIDVIGVTNHPPQLQNVEFQKKIDSCPPRGQQTDEARRVCATATDPDGDPLEFVWKATDTGAVTGEVLETTRTVNEDGSVQSCAQLAINQKGRHTFRLRVFDLTGEGKRFEKVLAEQQNQDIQSRAGVDFGIQSTVDCPPPEQRGRAVTILMALSQADGGDIPWLIQNSIRWATPVDNAPDTNVLYVLDDNSGDAFLPADRDLVLNILRNEGTKFATDAIEEPEGGLTIDQLEGYDVVWFANPTEPLDDATTFDTLRQFQMQGGGLILQGDDMAHANLAGDRSMQTFTGLEVINNGATACGDQIAGNPDNSYQLAYTDEPLSILEALRGRTFTYPEDIDHVRPTLTGEQVVANASYSSGDCTYRGPAVVGMDPGTGGDQQPANNQAAEQSSR